MACLVTYCKSIRVTYSIVTFLIRSTTKDSQRSATSTPPHTVGSFDHRRRDEFKQSTSGTYDRIQDEFEKRHGNQGENLGVGRAEIGQALHPEEQGGGGRQGGGLFADIMGFGGSSSPADTVVRMNALKLGLTLWFLVNISHSYMQTLF